MHIHCYSNDSITFTYVGLLLNEASIVDETSYDPEPEIDMDELLLECFLKTIKSVVKPEDLPLLTSTLYGSYMRQVW